MGGGAYGGGYGGGNSANCCVAQGEDCTACGVGCGGGGQGALAYVGTGQGEYIQPNRSSVAQRWEGAAPRPSLRPLPPFHPPHFQHPRRLRLRLRRPPDRQHPVDLWIPSIAQLIPRTLGPPIRRHGAAETTTAAALQPHRRRSPSSCQFHSLSRRRPIRTIAPMVSQTGRPVGQCPRRSGAAESTARAARIKAVAV